MNKDCAKKLLDVLFKTFVMNTMQTISSFQWKALNTFIAYSNYFTEVQCQFP